MELSDSTFELNARVRRRFDSRVGIVEAILPGGQYQVFFSDQDRPILAGQDLEEDSPIKDYAFVDGRSFLKDLVLFKTKKPLSDTLYSYAASRTNIELYQFKPVVKFINNPNQRLLIADEVGLGKTIEACLIYLELKARISSGLPRVLVVCPASLTRKWRDELYTRFGEQFSILDGNALDDFFRRWQLEPSRATLKGICSLERLRQQRTVEQLSELNVQFDLVIVDEAHHMRNPATLSFDLGEVISERSDSMVLLTATPVQLQALDLYYLLRILSPGEFESPDLFNEVLEPNRVVNRAISALDGTTQDVDTALSHLEGVSATIKENPYWAEAVALLENVSPNQPMSREQRVTAIRNMHKLNSLSYIFNRSRRSEVGMGATREANVVSITLNEIEEEIYRKALAFARAKAEQNSGYAFHLGLIQIERQIASSLGGYRIVVEDFIKNNRRTPIEIELSEAGENILLDDMDDEGSYSLKSNEVYELANELSSLYSQLGDHDSKFDQFKAELDKLLVEHPKVIVFSFFKRTLEYLRQRLSGVGYKVAIVHGDIPQLHRQQTMARFEESDDVMVLLSSEVGAEGLDFQFCDVIVNYDLPWNPMRVEQRIGRIDRYGQTSDKVSVASFFLNGTIEERILLRLYDRIGVFRESIGELEPILGNIVRELSREVITRNLSPMEEEHLLERHLDSVEHHRRDLEEFENNRYELMGHDRLFYSDVEDSISSGKYVSDKEIEALCFSYLDEQFPGCHYRRVNGTSEIWSLHPNRDFQNALLRLPYPRGNNDTEFIRKVGEVFQRGKSTTLSLTFSSKLAHQRNLLHFVNLWHPLSRMAIQHFERLAQIPIEKRILRGTLGVPNHELVGTYYFFMFSITTEGVTSSHELVPVLVNSNTKEVSVAASERFISFVQKATAWKPLPEAPNLMSASFESMKSLAFQYMGGIRANRERAARQSNQALITLRKQSLEKTYFAKLERAQEQLSRATNENIIRMHRGRIRNLEEQHRTATEELSSRESISVSYEPVAYGVIRLTFEETG